MRPCLALALLLLCGCVEPMTTVEACRRMTCPAPSKPLRLNGYKQRSVCVCAPAEEPDTNEVSP